MTKVVRALALTLVVAMLLPCVAIAEIDPQGFLLQPGMKTLRNMAYFLGEKVVGRWVTVRFEGDLFSAPALTTETYRRIHVGERFKIEGYYFPNEEEVWLYVKDNDQPAWIYAPVARVNKVLGLTDETAEYVGKKCKIKVVSGVARYDAGEEFSRVCTVYQNEYHEILDAKKASTGTIWFKICRNDYDCWVSSGIATLVQPQ